MGEYIAYQVWSIIHPYAGTPHFHGTFCEWSVAAEGRRGDRDDPERYALATEEKIKAAYHTRNVEVYVFTKMLRAKFMNGTLVYFGGQALFGEDWEHPGTAQ